MARRSTKLEIEGRRLMYDILQKALKSLDPTERHKALRTFIAYEKMILQGKRAKKPEGWNSWGRLMRETKKSRPRPGI